MHSRLLGPQSWGENCFENERKAAVRSWVQRLNHHSDARTERENLDILPSIRPATVPIGFRNGDIHKGGIEVGVSLPAITDLASMEDKTTDKNLGEGYLFNLKHSGLYQDGENSDDSISVSSDTSVRTWQELVARVIADENSPYYKDALGRCNKEVIQGNSSFAGRRTVHREISSKKGKSKMKNQRYTRNAFQPQAGFKDTDGTYDHCPRMQEDTWWGYSADTPGREVAEAHTVRGRSRKEGAARETEGSSDEEKWAENRLVTINEDKGKPNRKIPLTSYRRKSVLFSNKQELADLAEELCNSAKRFSAFPEKMSEWLTDNYYRLIDVFKRFDTDNSGKLSYDEFFLGMQDLGAPVTMTEAYMLAMSLDEDNDETIDYNEVSKIKRTLRNGAVARRISTDKEKGQEGLDSRVQLRPCPNCEIGIWEPVLNEAPRYICLHLTNLGLPYKDAFIGQFTTHVKSDITIYGITRIVKSELGGSAVDIRILRKKATKKDQTAETEILDQGLKLRDCGYSGGTSRDKPQHVELFYDYEYPKLDCPLLLANFYK